MKLEKYNPVSKCIVKRTKIFKSKFPVFDVHMHLGKLLMGNNFYNLYDLSDYMEIIKKFGIYKIINLDGFYGEDLDFITDFTKEYDEIINFIWIDLSKVDSNGFEEDIVNQIENGISKGAKGIKMWKDISLYKGIKVDDDRLNIVYKMAAKYNLPILMHIGDPIAFFDPLDNKNERYEELEENPDWNFSDRNKYPSFEELMESQENMIKNNPETTFIVAHVGSYSENLYYVDSMLNSYKNLYIDIAARISELGRVPYTSRKFFIKNQDKILFGSDSTPISYEHLINIFRFLETDDEYFDYGIEGEIPEQGRWKIYGIFLPDEVLEKIYYKNAERLFLHK